MSLSHAVAFVDPESAQTVQFASDHVVPCQVHEHLRFACQHHSGLTMDYAFYDQVCDAVDGISEVLVAGGLTGLADFRHFVGKHRPQTARRIVGYQLVDQPTEEQLVAVARMHFVRVNRMAGMSVSF